MNTITVSDDFDLYKITYSGQCFRAAELEDGRYGFITGEHLLMIRALNEGNTMGVRTGANTESESLSRGGLANYEISCPLFEWDSIWSPYFDLNTNYSSIRGAIPSSDKYIHTAAEIGCGIRILNQNPFEMLISFIISQRKSIPAIRSSVEKICEKWGNPIKCPEEISIGPVFPQKELKSFPTPSALKDVTPEDLSDCGLGYRVPYILDAIARVNDGRLDLEGLKKLNDEELFDALKSVYGVGDKVANCISLFAYHRTGRAPVDTWIAKVINEEYNGINPFPKYGENAGIMQQYVFYAAQHEKV